MTKGWTVDVRLRTAGGAERQLWPWEAAVPDRDAAERAVRGRLPPAGEDTYVVRAARALDEHEVVGRGLAPGMVRRVLMP